MAGPVNFRAKSYEELREERAKEWDAAQRKAQQNLADVYATVLKMPDVKDAPLDGVPWASAGIVCECSGTGFYVKRWVTVNGLRYRAELKCLGCHGHRTWDWTTKRWIEAERFWKGEAP